MGRDEASEGSLGPEFSALLTASFISNLGDGIRLAAFPLLAKSLTSSPWLIGVITAAQYLPWTTFAPFGGVVVDRADRRRLIMITQSWRAVVMLALGVAVATEVAEIWHLMVVAYVITAGEILVDPSVVATVPRLVSQRNLDRGNGRLTTVETVTNDFAGRPLGAFAFAFLPWLPFVIDAATYALSVGPFSRLPANEPKQGSSGSIRAEMGAGLRWIRDHAFLRPITAATAVFHLGTAGAFGQLVLLLGIELMARDIVFGLLLAASAVGATAASIVAAPLSTRFSRRTVVVGAALAATVSVLASAAVQTSWQLIVLWTINGGAAAAWLAISRGFVQRHTPADLLGRAAVASRTITRTSFVIGALLIGGVAEVWSIRTSFVVAGLLHLVGTMMLWRAFENEPSELD